MKKITSQKSARELKFGDQYVIDIYPDDPDKITEKTIEKANAIKEIANNIKYLSNGRVAKEKSSY